MVKLSLELPDPWKELRQDCFGNVEPQVELVGITVPVKYPAPRDGISDEVRYDEVGIANALTEDYSGASNITAKKIEELPALAAAVSYGSRDKLQTEPARAVSLNKKLIQMEHNVPLEVVQMTFHIKGISKACGAQLSRYRHTGHVSASRRYQEQGEAFVYPMLSYIKHEDIVRRMLDAIESQYKSSMKCYEFLRSDRMLPGGTGAYPEQIEIYDKDWKPLHKEDSRFIIPVASATERMWWSNVRELRHIFQQRLAPDAEWEIRRVAIMLYNIVTPLMPSLFEDLMEEK